LPLEQEIAPREIGDVDLDGEIRSAVAVNVALQEMARKVETKLAGVSAEIGVADEIEMIAVKRFCLNPLQIDLVALAMMEVLDHIGCSDAAVLHFTEHEAIGAAIAYQPILAETADQRVVAGSAA
jgi:hypothetical protein